MNIKLFTLKRAYVLTVLCCISMASTTWGNSCKGVAGSVPLEGNCDYNCECKGFSATDKPGYNFNCNNGTCNENEWFAGSGDWSLVMTSVVSDPTPMGSASAYWCHTGVNNGKNNSITTDNCGQ